MGFKENQHEEKEKKFDYKDKTNYIPYQTDQLTNAPPDTWYDECFEGILVETIEQLEELCNVKGKTLALDTETTGLTFYKDKIVGLSFSFSSKDGYYVPLRHQYGNVPLKEAFECVKKLLYNNKILMFNVIFDSMMLEAEGIDMSKVDLFEVQSLVFCADSNVKGRNLKWASEWYLGRKAPTFKQTLGTSSEHFHFGYLMPNESVLYTCHSKDTEVLTKDGWVFWGNYDGKTDLATVNLNNNFLEYQKPNKFIKYHYKGEMYAYKNINQDYKVTPNHRMIIHKNQNLKNKPEFREIKDFRKHEFVYNQHLSKLSTTDNEFIFGSLTISSTDLARLLGIVFSDGWVKTRIKTSRNYSIGIVVCKDTWREPIVDLLNRIGVKYGTYKNGTNYIFSNKELWTYLKPYVGEGARTKHIPEIIKQMSSEDISEFLLFFRYGDGHLSKDNINEQYYTTSPNMSDDLHELFAILGIRAKMVKRSPKDVSFKEGRVIKKENCADLYLFSVSRKPKILTYKHYSCTKELYDDYVYCAEVSNSTLITRRNGCILVSGNCSDSANTYGLYEKLFPILSKECGFTINLDNALVKAMLNYYIKQPIYIDSEKMTHLSEFIRTRILELERKIFGKLGTTVDLECVSYDGTVSTKEYGDINMYQLKSHFTSGLPVNVLTPLGYQEMIDFIDVGNKTVVEVELEDSSILEVSSDHYFLVKNQDTNENYFKQVLQIDTSIEELVSNDVILTEGEMLDSLCDLLLNKDNLGFYLGQLGILV